MKEARVLLANNYKTMLQAYRHLPRTTERPMRKRGDEPRSKFATSKACITCPEQLERGECSGLSARVVPQSHGRKAVVRGLQMFTEI